MDKAEQEFISLLNELAETAPEQMPDAFAEIVAIADEAQN